MISLNEIRKERIKKSQRKIFKNEEEFNRLKNIFIEDLEKKIIKYKEMIQTIKSDTWIN